MTFEFLQVDESHVEEIDEDSSGGSGFWHWQNDFPALSSSLYFKHTFFSKHFASLGVTIGNPNRLLVCGMHTHEHTQMLQCDEIIIVCIRPNSLFRLTKSHLQRFLYFAAAEQQSRIYFLQPQSSSCNKQHNESLVQLDLV